jgi:hypothetical protein
MVYSREEMEETLILYARKREGMPLIQTLSSLYFCLLTLS